MPNSEVIDILLIALAAVFLFRLYTVLGRRTGHERQRPQPAPSARDGVVAPPDRVALKPESAPSTANDPVARGLLDVKLADKTFESEHFLAGAKSAYEMILTAFAAGDRAALRPLLSDEVYGAFDSVIRSREERNEKVAFTFVGYKDAKIVQASLKGRMAEVTTAFGAQFISATSDKNGNVVEGDTKTVREVTDVWTFAREVRARDPNWTLVATSGDLP
jgi:predicted lipid-binding transport protein (Tim44 family)